MKGYAIRCLTCGWTRAHDTTEIEPGRWKYAPDWAFSFHRLATVGEPAHMLGFEREVEGVPVMTETEYLQGKAFDAGYRAGRHSALELVRSTVGDLA